MNTEENTIGLTKREWQIAKLMAQGMRMKEVAHAFGVSPFTVYSHIRNMYEKTGCRNMAHIVYKALTSSLDTAIEERCDTNKREMIQWLELSETSLLSHLERVLLQYDSTIAEATYVGAGTFFANGQAMPKPIRVARFPKGLKKYREAVLS